MAEKRTACTASDMLCMWTAGSQKQGDGVGCLSNSRCHQRTRIAMILFWDSSIHVPTPGDALEKRSSRGASVSKITNIVTHKAHNLSIARE